MFVVLLLKCPVSLLISSRLGLMYTGSFISRVETAAGIWLHLATQEAARTVVMMENTQNPPKLHRKETNKTTKTSQMLKKKNPYKISQMISVTQSNNKNMPTDFKETETFSRR